MSNSSQNRAAQAAWETKAEFWDNLHGDEGNVFHRHLISPSAESLLNIQPGEVILDIACGNGVFARRLAELGAEVVATDFSSGLLERAKARTTSPNIEYLIRDATDEAAMLTLGAGRFDAVVSNMALMDIADLAPMFRAIRQLLKASGRFVFTTSHPCYNSTDITMMLEHEDNHGQVIDTYSLKISKYLKPMARNQAGAPGEPTAHPVFHRPLHELLNLCFDAGFVLDRLVEPAFLPGATSKSPISWVNFTDIPPVLAARLRPFPGK